MCLEWKKKLSAFFTFSSCLTLTTVEEIMRKVFLVFYCAFPVLLAVVERNNKAFRKEQRSGRQMELEWKFGESKCGTVMVERLRSECGGFPFSSSRYRRHWLQEGDMASFQLRLFSTSPSRILFISFQNHRSIFLPISKVRTWLFRKGTKQHTLHEDTLIPKEELSLKWEQNNILMAASFLTGVWSYGLTGSN